MFQWMERGRALQHRYLERVRHFGMTPILPSFAGFVPASLLKKFPNATSRDSSGWHGFNPTHTLDPLDPLFARVGIAFVYNYCQEYGCSEVEPTFTADLYNELSPPKSDLTYLNKVSLTVQKTIQAGYDKYCSTTTDTTASITRRITWVTQGWMFHSGASFWNPERIKSFVTGPPIGSLIVLDLYAEVSPIYNTTGLPHGGFFGAPWIYSTIFNFGGRSGLYGRLDQLQAGLNQALGANASASNELISSSGNGMLGIGAAPEAIETDPIMYDLLYSLAWVETTTFSTTTFSTTTFSTTTSPLVDFVRNWATRRYHTYGAVVDARVVDAWITMYQKGPYACTRPQQGPTASLIAARPQLFHISRVSCCDRTDPYYSSSTLSDVWKSMLEIGQGSKALQQQPTFLHDVADIGTQVLSNLIYSLHEEASAAYNKSNVTHFRQVGKIFLQVVSDVDSLAATQDQRLLGQWIASARSSASTRANDVHAAAVVTEFPPKSCSASRSFNCGFPGINRSTCESQGCCFQEEEEEKAIEETKPTSELMCTFGQLTNDADVMEWNARQQVTLWANEKLGLHEYAYRLWGGLVQDFYYERWRRFFQKVEESMVRGETFSNSQFSSEIEIWEQQWCRQTGGNFSTLPSSNVLAKANVIYNKYFW